MVSKSKASKKNVASTGISNKKNFLDFFLNSPYSPYIIPAIYFFIYGFIIMTNHPVGDYGVENDFYRSYIPQAKELLNGHLSIDMYRGPVYQIVLSVTGFLIGHDFFSAGKFINVLFASIALIFVFKIVSSILNNEAAFFTTLLTAVNLNFMSFSFRSGTDMVFLALYLASVYYILRSKEINQRDFLIAGILSGLAYATRYTAISLIFSVLIILIITYFKNKESNEAENKPVLTAAIYYFIPVLIIIIAWGIFCYAKTGMFFYNYNFFNTASLVYKPDMMSNDEWTLKYEPGFTSMLDVVLRNPGMFMYKLFIENFPLVFITDLHTLIPLYLGIFTAIGLIIFLITFKSQSLGTKFYFLISFIFYLQVIFTFYSERYSLPLLPFYVFLAVNIFYSGVIDKLKLKSGGIMIARIILSILVIASASGSLSQVEKKLNSVPTGILDISEWMKKNYSEDLKGKTIMSRAPHIAYYLDMNFEVIPYADNYKDFMKNINEKKIEYLYVNQWEMKMFNNSLMTELLNFKSPPPGLEMIVYTVNPTAIIYKVKNN